MAALATGGGTPSDGATSFQRKVPARSRLAAIAGTRPSVRHGQLLLSSGLPSLDCVLGWCRAGTRPRSAGYWLTVPYPHLLPPIPCLLLFPSLNCNYLRAASGFVVVGDAFCQSDPAQSHDLGKGSVRLLT
uniref:Uncharacterized protein n=1 Tax=Chelonoidis abingdonii TaxID=106734 RepID=A0A8C0J0Y3_CHEAB